MQALQTCENEPIRTPDSVQPHGCVCVCDLKFNTVTHVSQNTEGCFGKPPEEILGKPVTEIFSHDFCHALRNAASLRTIDTQREYLGQFDLGRGYSHAACHIRGAHIIIELGKGNEELEDYRLDINRLRWLLPRWSPENHVLLDALELMVNDLRSLTGFDRVMAYRFRPDGSGEVIAESLAPKTDSYLGLRFPKWDIPQIARAISLEQPLRLISDIAMEDVPLLACDEHQTPVDMTLTELRGTSPVHKTYLSNMGVRGSLVLPVVVNKELWGMFSFHHRAPRHFNIEQSLSIEMVGQMLNMHIAAILQSDYTKNVKRCHDCVRNIPSRPWNADRTAISQDGWEKAANELCLMLRLDGMVLEWGKEQATFGTVPAVDLVNVKTALTDSPTPSIAASDQISFAPIAGAMRIDIDRTEHVTLWLFRKEENQKVTWAGAPSKETKVTDNTLHLLPRNSFSAYVEESSDKSRAWEPEDLTLVLALQDALCNLVLNEREKRKTTQNHRLVISELNHRMRNMLSLIMSIIQRTALIENDVRSYADALGKRIYSLASAHDLLTHKHDIGLEVRSALQQELLPFPNNSIRLDGPDIMLDSESCTIFVLVLHEIITNAAKYGALSRESGKLSILWAVTEQALTITILESGGPPVQTPAHTGLGKSLIDEAIPHQLGGESFQTFKANGVETILKIPERFLIQDRKVPLEKSDEEESNQDPKKNQDNLSVLILEDNYLIGTELRTMVRNIGGTQVQLVKNNHAALALLHEDTIDFAVLDVRLSEDASSQQTAQLLQEMSIPYIFLTGYDEDYEWMKDFSSIPILSKPVRSDDLAQSIALLSKNRLRNQSLSILLVEDNILLQNQLELDLSKMGHRVESATNAMEAGAILNSTEIDAIIIDIFTDSESNLSKESTLRIVSRIRNNIKNQYKVDRDVPILAISGGMEIPGGFSPLKLAQQVGADAWLRKPISHEQLEEWVGNVAKKIRTKVD